MDIQAMVQELLNIEETNNIFNLTTRERRDFQEKVLSRTGIPEHHGSLIDANDLLRDIEHEEAEPEYLHCNIDYYLGLMTAEKVIQKQPTILEEEQ